MLVVLPERCACYNARRAEPASKSLKRPDGTGHTLTERGSTLGLPQRKFPHTVEDFRSRAEQRHGTVPSPRDWTAIGDLGVRPPELDVDRTIRDLRRRDA